MNGPARALRVIHAYEGEGAELLRRRPSDLAEEFMRRQ